MQYLLSVQHHLTSTGDYEISIPEDVNVDDLFTSVAALNADLETEGAWIFAAGLQPPSEGAVVDVNGGEVVIVEGPDDHPREFLGGFWIIEVADHETALDWACRASAAVRQEIHVRAFQHA